MLASLAILPVACLAPRVQAAEIDRLITLLGLEPGATVADVGAGDGRWSALLGEAVGPGGQVLATEVDREEVEKIEKRARREKLDNVTAILGDQRDTGLPVGCCDAILLRMVYHHFTEPNAMRASLKQALRPGGRIVIIETEPQSGWRDVDGELDRGGHGIPLEVLLEEMTGDGFELVERLEHYEGPHGDPYCLVFRRPSS